MPTPKTPARSSTTRCLTHGGLVPTGPVGRTRTVRIRASMHKLTVKYAHESGQAIRDVVEDALHHYIVTTDARRKSKKRVSFGAKV